MQTIQLTQGFVALVDDADFERVSVHKWSLHKTKTNLYAVRKVRKTDGTATSQLLHRFIMGVTDRRVMVDHEDHNGLNCQRYNLRIATGTQNNANRSKTYGSSRYKGVVWDTGRGLWRTDIRKNGRSKHLGRFTDETQAALAYDAAARKHFGEFACCNFPPKNTCGACAPASMIAVVTSIS